VHLRRVSRTCGFRLALLTLLGVLAARTGDAGAGTLADALSRGEPGQAAPPPDCTPLEHDPLPALDDSPETTKRLTTCGYLLTNRGDYRRASVLFDTALAMATRRADPASRAVALAGLGLSLGTLGQAERAEKMLTESFEISEELQDADGMAEASSQIGHLRTQAGRYLDSRTYHLRSFELWKSIDDHRGMAVGLNNVGATYRAVGDNITALDYFQRSLDELERMGDGRRSATVLDNIGRIWRTLGDYGKGLALSQRAFAIRETLDDREGMSRSLNSLSDCYQAQGNYSAALDALRRSLELRNRIGYVLAIAEAQNNIAVVYQAQGNYSQAVAYLRKSLALNSAKVHSQPLAAEIYTHLGEIFSEQGLNTQAVQALTRSLGVSRTAGLTLQAAAARLSLARTYIRQARWSLAAGEIRQVLAFSDTTGDRSIRAEALIGMAEIERRRGRPAEGLTLASQAREMADAMETPELRWQALTAVGRMTVALKQPAQARDAFEGAIDVVEHLRVLNSGAEESRTRFFASRLSPYHERIALALAGGNVADAFSFAERSKARTLLDAIRGDRVPVTRAMTDVERQEEIALRTSLSSANNELMVAAQAEPRDVARVTSLQRKRDQRRVAYEDYQACLYLAHPELQTSRADVAVADAAEAQRLVAGAREAIVEFVAGADRIHAFVITSSGLRAFALTPGAAEIGRAVEQFRDRLATRDLRAGESARRLYGMVLAPMRSVLSGKTSLIIVPDGLLWNLPFQALQGSDGRYLIEDAAVSYVPSITVLRETTRPRQSRATAPALLAFGDPVTAATAARAGETRGTERGGLTPLPQAAREVRALAAIYGPSSRIYVGAEAREDRWKSEAPSYRVLHLATHGVLDNASPLYSHLALARGGGSDDDGLLEAWEIMNTPLGADLVVLSACETARGRVAAGEGVIGLMWALFVAGAPATLVSQWQVDSASTTALMLAFHRAWDGGDRRVSKAEALRAASLQVLHTPGFSHPFYWAGFILTGNPR